MRITWYGHAAFLVETHGLRIILDPYRSPESGGYLPIDEPADLVIVSHTDDIYHSYTGQIVPPFQLVRALELPPGGEVIRGIRFETVHAFESSERLPDEEVTIIHFRADNMHVVYLGDLGHALTENEVAPLRGADIVLIPAGSTPTIAYPEIPPLLDAIGPRLVLPMHYKTRKINLNIKPLPRYLEGLPNDPVLRPGASFVDITPASLPESRTQLVLDYAR
jgi:L-ascorbate metabolism protein UlaG (beta-lactamase superfamily)